MDAEQLRGHRYRRHLWRTPVWAVPIPLMLHQVRGARKVPDVPGPVLWRGDGSSRWRRVYFLFNLRLMTASLRESKELSIFVGLDAPW